VLFRLKSGKTALNGRGFEQKVRTPDGKNLLKTGIVGVNNSKLHPWRGQETNLSPCVRCHCEERLSSLRGALVVIARSGSDEAIQPAPRCFPQTVQRVAVRIDGAVGVGIRSFALR